MSKAWGTYHSYKQVDVETASQGKLVVMLFDGAIQRAETAKRAMQSGDIQSVHASLVRAQDIIAELRAALDPSAGEFVQNVDRVYEYLAHLLIRANIEKSPAHIDEFVQHAGAMRDTWDEAFGQVERKRSVDAAPHQPRPMMNLQG